MQAFVTAKRWFGPKGHPFTVPVEDAPRLRLDCKGQAIATEARRHSAPFQKSQCSRAWTRNAMIVDSPSALLASSR
jgi:hypothetical protein